MQFGPDGKYKRKKGVLLFFLLSLAACIGLAFGILCYLYADIASCRLLVSAIMKVRDIRRSGDISAILFDSFKTNGIYILAAFSFGFCAVAQPLEFLLPFIKGICSGIILTNLYSGCFSDDALINVLSVFPGILFSVIVIILASRESVFLSDRLFGICIKKHITDGLFDRLKVYLVRFAVYIAMISLCSVLDCILALSFSGKT